MKVNIDRHTQEIAALLSQITQLEEKVRELEQENKKLEQWVDDLQSGMYINCVYCGHRYPPGTLASRRKILYEHIKQCPKHPLRQAESSLQSYKNENEQLRQQYNNLADEFNRQHSSLTRLLEAVEVHKNSIRLHGKVRADEALYQVAEGIRKEMK